MWMIASKRLCCWQRDITWWNLVNILLLNAIVHLMYVNASNREVSNTGLKGLQFSSQSIVGHKLLTDGWRKLGQLV